MKNVFYIMLLVLGFASCSTSKIIGYSYTEGNMMGSTKTTITSDSLSFLKYKSGQKSYEAYTSKTEDWVLVHDMGKHINYEGMDTLTAPSKGFATDASPYAHIEIITKDSTYYSSGFDAGNPPNAIAAIVLQLSQISKNATLK